MITEADYQRALGDEDPEYRQWFLNQIDLENAKHYVRKTVYCPIDGGCSMSISPPFLSRLHVRGMKSVIKVYPPSFSGLKLMCLDDFLGLIIEHEGFHAMEIYTNPEIMSMNAPREVIIVQDGRKIINPELFEYHKFLAAREMRAYRNALEAINKVKRRYSDTYVSCLRSQFNLAMDL